MPRSLALLACVVMLALVAPSARGQEVDQEKRLLISKLTGESLEAFNAEEYAKAEQVLRRLLVLDPGNFVTYYNLGCARAMQGDSKGAAGLIVQAVEHGFSDLRRIDQDPHLASVRGDPAIADLRARWPEVLSIQAENNLKDAQRLFQKGYHVERDERLRVIYLSAFNPKSFEQARGELTRIADWAHATLFPELAEPGGEDPWVLVVLPSKGDFTAWARASYGSGAVQGTSMIAGSYMHDQKRLVAMDLGATMRHEFLHALHWRHTTRLGQAHPIWVLEGLGALVEDVEADAAGVLRPTTSWRTNTAKRIERLGKLAPISKFSRMPYGQFAGQRPLANYAQARAFFLYLHDKGRLGGWYKHYTEHYREDPTGVKSLQAVLDKPPAEIDQDFRAWVRLLDPVAEEIKPGMASLGVEIEAGSGDGPVIVSIPRGSGGPRLPLRLGDIITAIDDKPTRDIAELVRVLGGYEPGDRVRVSYRRGALTGEGEVVLVPR